MAMPGAGPVDDGPWIECFGCGATLHWTADPPICDECFELARDDDEEESD